MARQTDVPGGGDEPAVDAIGIAIERGWPDGVRAAIHLRVRVGLSCWERSVARNWYQQAIQTGPAEDRPVNSYGLALLEEAAPGPIAARWNSTFELVVAIAFILVCSLGAKAIATRHPQLRLLQAPTRWSMPFWRLTPTLKPASRCSGARAVPSVQAGI